MIQEEIRKKLISKFGHSTNTDIIDRYRLGGNDAWEVLMYLVWIRYYVPISDTAKQIIKDQPDEYDDLIADFALYLHGTKTTTNKLNTFKGQGSFREWLLLSAERYFLRRKQDPYLRKREQLENLRETVVVDSDYLEHLKECIDCLDEEKKIVFELEMQDYSVPEITRIINEGLVKEGGKPITEGAVYKRRERAIEELRRYSEASNTILCFVPSITIFSTHETEYLLRLAMDIAIADYRARRKKVEKNENNFTPLSNNPKKLSLIYNRTSSINKEVVYVDMVYEAIMDTLASEKNKGICTLDTITERIACQADHDSKASLIKELAVRIVKKETADRQHGTFVRNVGVYYLREADA